MKIICLFKGHKWTKAQGYYNTYCGRCKEWYTFYDAEDSPQGRGELKR